MTKLIPLSRAVAQATVVLGACLLACAGPASAFTASGSKPGGENTPIDTTTTASGPHVGSGGASVVRTIVGLAIVIAVIWGLSWVMRQVKAGRDPQLASTGLASVSALTLGSGRSVHLVRAGNEYVLLGSAEHGVVPIHRYSEQEAQEAGILPVEPAVRTRRLSSLLRSSPAGPHPSGQSVHPAGEDPAGEGRTDPMRMPSQSSNVLNFLRELTVRR
jgi:flagellar protein FliO/FliZ